MTRRDLEAPAKLLDALAHGGNAHADDPSPDALERGLRDAVAPILNLQHEPLGVTPQPDAGGLALRVSMNVDQRFLDDSEERRLGVARQPPETLRQLEIHFDAAAL